VENIGTEGDIVKAEDEIMLHAKEKATF